MVSATMENLDKASIDFWIAINLAQQAVTNRVEERLKEKKLPPIAWFEVLFELERADRDLRPYELQELLLLKQYNLSRLLARMLHDGVIETGQRPNDGRGKSFRVSPQGQKLSRQMWWAYEPVLREARLEIDKHTDITTITTALRSLVDHSVLLRTDPFQNDSKQ